MYLAATTTSLNRGRPEFTFKRSIANATNKCVCRPSIVLLLGLLASCLSAQTVVINATDRGWYDIGGSHSSSLKNYVAGDSRGNCSLCEDDFRNFFVFDLAGITQPIASGKLALFNPGPTPTAGYMSNDPSETFELHDITTAISTLRATNNGAVAIWNDLGTGAVYGSKAMTAADQGDYVEITLNSAAVAAMNSNHGLFGIGGSITSLDDVANSEIIFSGSDGRGIATAVQLRLTYVPEPSTLLLLSIASINLLRYRKAK